MNTQVTEGPEGFIKSTSSHLNSSFYLNASDSNSITEVALRTVHQTMDDMLLGNLKTPTYYLASLDPGTGKTEALCAFLRISQKSDSCFAKSRTSASLNPGQLV